MLKKRQLGGEGWEIGYLGRNYLASKYFLPLIALIYTNLDNKLVLICAISGKS